MFRSKPCFGKQAAMPRLRHSTRASSPETIIFSTPRCGCFATVPTVFASPSKDREETARW